MEASLGGSTQEPTEILTLALSGEKACAVPSGSGVDEIAFAMGIRPEVVRLVEAEDGSRSVLLTTRTLLEAMYSPELVLRPGTCEACWLPTSPMGSPRVLADGAFGTSKWADDHLPSDPFDVFLQDLVRDHLAYSGDNVFCQTCWASCIPWLLVSDELFIENHADHYAKHKANLVQSMTRSESSAWIDIVLSACDASDEEHVVAVAQNTPRSAGT